MNKYNSSKSAQAVMVKRYAGLIQIRSIRNMDKKPYDNKMDYRGNIGIILLNNSNKPFDIHEGDRICQFVLNKVEQIEWEETDNLGETDRGEGGFNSTGIK